MRITILTSSDQHPVYAELQKFQAANKAHDIDLKLKVADVADGDILFLISCSEIVKKDVRDRFKHTLVVHAADLPKGRGWSPHIWTVLEGGNEITVSLIEAEDKVDTGRIWAQEKICLEGHELYNEINDLLFVATIRLMNKAVSGGLTPRAQTDEEATYWPKRTPEMSEIAPDSTIEQVFNLLRVSDPVRYPAFFRLKGHKYKIKIEKDDE